MLTSASASTLLDALVVEGSTAVGRRIESFCRCQPPAVQVDVIHSSLVERNEERKGNSGGELFFEHSFDNSLPASTRRPVLAAVSGRSSSDL